MKKVIFAVLGGLLIALAVVSCTNDTTDENIYEQNAIDNKEVKDSDI